jgi:transcriptional regulator with XRE-family HTH domain
VALSYRRTVGQNIRKFRKKACLSQEQLAEKADLSYKYVGEVERGQENISLDALVRIANALKVPLADLIRGI